jgi:hypothetical protein
MITGHSLGGALAVLCAHILQAEGWTVHSVYTFGQPRVGDRAFAAAYNGLKAGQASSLSFETDRPDACPTLGSQTFRLVNENDIVPRLPGWVLGYRHAGQHEFITAAGALVENPSLFTIALTDALGLYAAWRRFDDVVIEDHFMGAYLKALNDPNF